LHASYAATQPRTFSSKSVTDFPRVPVVKITHVFARLLLRRGLVGIGPGYERVRG
jgi:hypothetical protein